MAYESFVKNGIRASMEFMEERRGNMIYKYIFGDGTVLRLLGIGLSVEEVWALEKLHGKCKLESEET